jgi:hypothetical protein
VPEDRIEYPAGVKAAVALSAILSLWGVFEFATFEPVYQQQNRDVYQITAQLARFDAIRAAAPENAVLGYVTDLSEGIAADAMFGGAQYALAPRILQRNAEQDLVLGNFAKPADFAALGGSHGLRVDRDFGNGVVLYRREAR